MIIKAKIYRADTPNANGYKFTSNALENAVTEFNKREHFAVSGEYPPTPAAHDTSANNILGPVTLEFIDGYVVATVKPYPVPGGKFKQAIKNCADIKVMPIGAGRLETVDNVDMIIRNHFITQIICTCEDLNCANCGTEMFIADITDD